MCPPRLPQWLRVKPPDVRAASRLHDLTYARGLSTVCVEARCPNRGDCYQTGTATFLILGSVCTRNCSFCAVRHGPPAPLVPEGPQLVADAVVRLGLRHVVVTSVTRDDLPDGGAHVFAETIRAIRERSSEVTVEVLVPDFRGRWDALATVVEAAPNVLGHNLETVSRLYPVVRSAAVYERSLELLRRAAGAAPNLLTKSGIMIGLGETRDEILDLIGDLVAVKCRVLTIGQYLRPTKGHHRVERYAPPEEFEELKRVALNAGMREVAAGPLVRSSYKAGEVYRLAASPSPLLPHNVHRNDPM